MMYPKFGKNTAGKASKAPKDPKASKKHEMAEGKKVEGKEKKYGKEY